MDTVGIQNEIVLFLGQKGSGKSTKADQMAREQNRIIVFDPQDDFGGGVTVRTLESFETIINEITPEDDFRIVLKFRNELNYEEAFSIIYPIDDFPPIEKYLIKVDETHLFATGNYINPNLKRIVTTGRHAEINQWYITQRPMNLNPTIRSQADRIICGRLTNERDLKVCKEAFGMDTAAIQRLQPREFIDHTVL